MSTATQDSPAGHRSKPAGHLECPPWKKVELLRWAAFNRATLREHDLCATGTTGTMVEYELGLPVTRFLSGPVGGDQQIGAKIADFLISSPLLANGYAGIRPEQLAG